jgi:hypothetical protein
MVLYIVNLRVQAFRVYDEVIDSYTSLAEPIQIISVSVKDIGLTSRPITYLLVEKMV